MLGLVLHTHMSRQANRDERKVVARDARDVVRGGVARRHVAPLREGIYLCVQQWQCVWLVFRHSFSQLVNHSITE